MKYFIHEKAIVDSTKIGEDTKIWAFVHILSGAVIGKNANICDHCFIENNVTIGDDVTIKCGVWIWDGVSIGNKVFIGPSVVFTNDLFPRSKNKDYVKKNTILKDGCSLGANATILAGVTIGKGAMVGAGSVVTKDIPDFGLVYGNPSRFISYICDCNEKFNIGKEGDRYICQCGKKYIMKSGVIKLTK